MAFADINATAYHNKHVLPNAFRDDAENWWNIEDWAEYYYAFVGSLPTGSMKLYQDPGTAENPNNGYTGKLYFKHDGNDLIIEPNSYGLGSAAFAIVDIQRISTDSNECIPAGFEDVINDRLIMTHNAFMHRFNACNHPYSYFLNLAKEQGYESYFYRPNLDFSNIETF
jgi:hypothetical protein